MQARPSRDRVIMQDKAHAAMMERGSERLWQRIHAYQTGRRLPANDTIDFPWRYQGGQKFRPIDEIDATHLIQDRTPCVRCGVREDRHAEGGCSAFLRGRAQ